MENWNENIDSIIGKIDPLQLSKIIEIGNILKNGLDKDFDNHIKAIKTAERELLENFDDQSCQILLSIIGNF